MTTAVTPPRHTKSGGMSRLGDAANRPSAADLSGVTGPYLASPDPDRNMVKSSMTIGIPRFAAALD